MNIFVTHPDPLVSAKALDNKRINKMIVESAQMLSTAVRNNAYDLSSDDHKKLYKRAFPNHPCTRWTQSTDRNFRWLVAHALELCRIYQAKTNKEHKSFSVIMRCAKFHKALPEGRREPFVFAAIETPEKRKWLRMDVCEAYRAYLNWKWDYNDKKPLSGSLETPEMEK